MSGSAYSPFKIVHHPDRLETLRQGGQIVPVHVQLILSDLCSHDCHFCAYRWSGYSSNQLFAKDVELAAFGTNNPIRMIDYDKACEIVDDCADMGVKAIQITGGGEPTVHPKLKEVMQRIVEKGMDLSLVTHGAKLSAGVKDMLMRAAWIRVSIDAGCAKTYARVRRISEEVWDRTWGNIADLVRMKRETGSAIEIGTSFVLTKENWREVKLCAEKAKETGVNNFRCCAVFQPEDATYFDDFYDEAVVLCREVETLSDGNFTVYNAFGERVGDLVQQSPDYSFCGYQQFVGYIGADLNVYRCCVLAYNERGKIGSIKDQSYKQLWESEQKKLAIAGFDARGCDRCGFNSRNRAILYAIDPKPAHVNFV